MNKNNPKVIKPVPSKLKSYKPIIRFCILFFGLLILLTTTFPFLSDKFNSQITWLMVATSDITGFLLKAFGLSVQTHGNILSLPNFSVEIVGECTGLYEMLIFMAAVIAYPSGWRKKLIGAGLGIPLLYLINIIRMIFITIMGNWSPRTFDFMHMYFWQVAMILIIVSTWVLWIEKIVHCEKQPVGIHFIVKFIWVSGPLFVLWYWKGQDQYLVLFNYALTFLLIKTAGFNLQYFPAPKDIFNNLIPFISLMLITRGIPSRKRVIWLVEGLLILIGWHMVLTEVVYFLGVDSPTYDKFSVPIYLFSETLPFILWILFARRQVAGLFLRQKK